MGNFGEIRIDDVGAHDVVERDDWCCDQAECCEEEWREDNVELSPKSVRFMLNMHDVISFLPNLAEEGNHAEDISLEAVFDEEGGLMGVSIEAHGICSL
jgi:Fe-S-cluster formation regulator IscX/YfhJ